MRQAAASENAVFASVGCRPTARPRCSSQRLRVTLDFENGRCCFRSKTPTSLVRAGKLLACSSPNSAFQAGSILQIPTPCVVLHQSQRHTGYLRSCTSSATAWVTLVDEVAASLCADCIDQPSSTHHCFTAARHLFFSDERFSPSLVVNDPPLFSFSTTVRVSLSAVWM